ncbi:MAG: NusG domain II-containing protein [Candidatus Caldatribacterium sp.]|uniref:NusG domain II-containing protein n=1 Tax=Candidatus Caldatribacterium sp. TaxID=2282143 RepID=UPI002998D11D|nr:NusG domain II-containing protein [Candidatus Caldatribacterium sp.]MCX7729732.1 NusG domain II-containing protein [Candidatus Caldatribacterium sp.]MDW8081154.1 NusG domain II-containing protein [Candidatus Calescibacterium sp.]
MYLFRKSDWFTLGAVGVVLGILFLFRYVPFASHAPERFTVTFESMEGMQEVLVTPERDEEIALRGPLGVTIVAIRGGRVFVVTSPCPDKVCIKTGKIPDDADFIACVPNRVFIRIRR